MQYLTIEQTAENLGTSTKSVRRYIARGDLPAYRIRGSRSIRIKAADVDALMVAIPTAA